MARTTPSSKSRGKAAAKASQQNRTVALALAGFTALVIVVIALFAVLSTAGGDDFTPNDQGLIPVGETAPGFTAETVGGGSVSVGEGGAPATMLVFFATWCPHCQAEAPVISDLEGQYDDLRVTMVGIDGQDDPQKVRQFVEEHDIESPAVFDPSLGSEYRVSGYPTVYVLDENNQVVGAHSGEAPEEVYEGWIEEAL